MQLIMHACILFISYMASRFIVGGSMMTGELMSLITYGLQIRKIQKWNKKAEKRRKK